MPRVAPIQQSFNAGELSPLMFARSDINKYKNGLHTCINTIPLVQGGWTRRPGEYYVAPTKANGAARLVRFEFSTTQAYIIEFGNLYARFYKDHGAITETGVVITGATQANPVVVTAVAHGYTNGDEVEIASVGGMTQLNGRRFVCAGTTANTFQLYDVDAVAPVNGTAYGAYTAGGTVARVYTLTTTYATADLFALKFSQSADTLYIAHPSYPPRRMTRTGHAAWSISTIAFQDGPFLNVNTGTTTLGISATTGSATVTASAITGINSDTGFQTTDIGRSIRWKDPAGNWTWMTITARANATSATATIQLAASGTTATANWRLGVWSATTGYPGAVCFSDDRLCYGGPTSYPQRIDMSNSSDYENYAPSNAAGTVGASNSIAVTLNASDVNVIRWLQDDEKGLLVGTVGGEWIVRPSTQSEAMTPTNVTAKRSTTYGSANMQPIRAGKATLYMQRSSRKLRELAYVYQDDGFRAPDLTVLSEHITYGGVAQIGYQQETQSIVWGARNDGVMIGFTYERDQEVLGWHRHIMGGYYDSAQTVRAKVESVAAIPAPDGTRDELWTVTNRYINGAQRRFVGYLKKPWERGDAQADAFHVDAGLSLNNTVAQTLTPGAAAPTVGSTGVIFTTGGAYWAVTDVNRYIHYDYTDANGVLQRASAIITGYTDATHVTATILSAWPNTNLIASGGWRISVTTVSGAWHLEGQSVAIYADGAQQPNATVASGAVTLTYPASKVALGLAYNSDGQRMRDDAGAADGTAQGKTRRANKVIFRFHDTLGVKIGPSFGKLTPVTFRTSADPSSVAPPLFSGDKEIPWEGDYDRDGYVCWRCDTPHPATVLAIGPRMVTQDGS